MKTTLFLLLLFASAVGLTAEYKCTISRIDFGDDLEVGVKERWNKQLVGKFLLVDTRTGVMTGALNNSLYKPPLLLNSGDSENSFVSATIVSPRFDQGVVGVDTRIITIQTWKSGSRKPFSLFWDDMLMRGRCSLQ